MKTKLVINNDKVKTRAVNMINALDIDAPVIESPNLAKGHATDEGKKGASTKPTLD